MDIERKTTIRCADAETPIFKGDILDFGGTKWRVLDKNDAACVAFIMKINNIENMVFGDDNDYESSKVRAYLRSDEFKETIPDELMEMVTSEFDLLTIEQIETYLPGELDRIVLGEDGETTWWWTATPYPSYAYDVRYVDPSGALYYSGAFSALGVVPACYIRHR